MEKHKSMKGTLKQRKFRATESFKIKVCKLIDDFKFTEDPTLKISRKEKIRAIFEIAIGEI